MSAPEVVYEVWRSHRTGPDVLICQDRSERDGRESLAMCNDDKASGYPDAPIEFYLVRATTTRERIPAPSVEARDDH